MSKWKFTLLFMDRPDTWELAKFRYLSDARWIAEMLRDRGYVTKIEEKK